MSIPKSTSNTSPSMEKGSRDRLFVIGAGLSRTATETMCEAMEILLGQPAYHGGTMIVSHGPAEADLWRWQDPDALPNFSALFDHRADGQVYSSCFDLPCNMWVTELMEHYPNARVVLMKRRSAGEWAASMTSTVIPLIWRFRLLNRITCGIFGELNKVVQFSEGYLMKKGFGFGIDEATPERLEKFYESHLQRMRRVVPADRLIEFSASEGWEPLCKGLQLPIPSVPFPRKNERSGFMGKFGTTGLKTMARMTGSQMLVMTIALILLAAVVRLWRFS